MKLNKKIKWLYLLILPIMILACETNRETYEEFFKDGETLYIGAADTIIVKHGYNKLRFVLGLNSDPKISKGIITSTDGLVNNEFDIQRTQSGYEEVSVDIALEEKDYTFEIVLGDNSGNTSIPREISTRVYGEKFEATLLPRAVSAITAGQNETIIDWDTPVAGTIETVLTYIDGSGTTQTITVANDEDQTILSSIEFGSEYTIASSYYPEEGAFETFNGTAQDNLPSTFLVDKSTIVPLRLPFDATDGCWGSTYDRLLDGGTGDFWHSCDIPEDQYPFVMSFDMGVDVSLTQFRLDERADCCGSRSPMHMQFWGTNDIALGETTADIDAADLATWEADATAKGWVKVDEFNDNANNTFERELTPSSEKFRYIRLVYVSAIDGGLTGNFNELTFWSR